MLEVINLRKTYNTRNQTSVKALDGISIKFPETGLVFLLGKSGSGKSTLLNVIGGLDKASSGEIIVKGKNSKEFTNSDFDSYRNTLIGFIFQEYNILNEFNVYQNIALALELQHKKATKEEVDRILREVDMEGYAYRNPMTLSGGQKQRVAIARALVKNPEIIMADEPTGALDSVTGKQVFDTLKKLSDNRLVIVVSHDRDFAELYADRIIELKDGKIISDVSKRSVPAVRLTSNINILRNTIQIKDTKALTDDEINLVVSKIKECNGELILTTGKNDVPKVKNIMKITDNNESDIFYETKERDDIFEDGSKTTFIKSSLPFSKAFKIGVSSLKTKPVRLIFTIILTVISLILFGLTSCLMMYESSYTVSNAMKDSFYDTEVISKNKVINYRDVEYEKNTDNILYSYEYEYYYNTLFGKNEVDELNNKDKNINHNYIGIFDWYDSSSLMFSSYYSSYGYTDYPDIYIENVASKDMLYFPFNYSVPLKGFADASEEVLNKSFEKKCGSYPNSKSEIAISSYLYSLIKLNESFNISKEEDAIGKTLTIKINDTSINMTICGIYDVGALPAYFEKLETLAEYSKKEQETIISNYELYLFNSFNLVGFVNPLFFDEYNETFKVEEYKPYFGSEYNYNLDIKINNYSFCEYITLDMTKHAQTKYYNISGTEIESPTSIEKGECYIPYSYFDDNLTTITYTVNDGDEKSLTVVGYYEFNDYNTKYILLSEEFESDKLYVSDSYYISYYSTNYTELTDAKYSYILTKTNYTQAQCDSMLYDNVNMGYSYSMTNPIYSQISVITSLVTGLKEVFLTLGIVTGVFASLLIANFITVSITAKKREIGILRAVGARQSDVFRIFYSESFVIAVICFVISCVLTLSLTSTINTEIGELYMNIKILNFNILNALIIFVLSLIISTIATFIPVFIASKKPPVESIRSL